MEGEKHADASRLPAQPMLVAPNREASGLTSSMSQLALILGRVPHVLDELVVRVRQRFLALAFVKPYQTIIIYFWC